MAATAAGPHLVASAGATTSKTLLVACLAAAAAAEACWRDRISQQKNLTAATKCLLPEPANAAYISPPHPPQAVRHLCCSPIPIYRVRTNFLFWVMAMDETISGEETVTSFGTTFLIARSCQ